MREAPANGTGLRGGKGDGQIRREATVTVVAEL